MSDNGQQVPLPGCMIGPSEPCDAFQRQTARIAEMEAALAERTRERDAAIALVAELVQIENDHDDVVFVRLYGKPHTPEHKARVLDLRQRKTDAWRKARVAIAAALAEPPR